MVHLKPSGTAVSEPKPKYGRLSQPDPEFEPLKEGTDKVFAKLWALDLANMKARCKKTPPAMPSDIPIPGKDIEITHLDVPVRDGTKVNLRIYKSMKQNKNALLNLNAHGGGWTLGSHDVEEAQNRFVAAENGAVVVSVEYRLAPEFKFPFAVNDCFDVLNWCKANSSLLGIDPERIIVSGGSAGGNIAAVLTQMARDQNISGIIGQVLNVPVTCHPKHFPSDKYEYGSYQQNKDASFMDSPMMDWFWDQYLPNAEPHVYANPLLARDLSNLAPALVQIAGQDPLRDEGFAYAEALKAAGNSVTLRVYPGLPHGFYTFPQLTSSVKYLQSVVDFIRQIDAKGSGEVVS